eukprot:s1405_g4.t1
MVSQSDYLATGYPEATEVFLSRNAEQIYLSQIIRSQDEMCRHFLPILRKCGIVVRRKGWRLARPAMRGEEVLTIVDGEEISKALVDDDSSMVIMAETTDREWYVLGSDSFRASYECPGIDIKDDSPDSTAAATSNHSDLYSFKYYKRHGMARMYQVSDSDLDFLPSRKFFCKGTTFPLLLRAGDYLVTGYPDSSEIYLSRHGEEVFEHVSHRELIRSQEEMCERFRPVLLQRGVRVPRSGYTLARPAKDENLQKRTLIDGEMVAKVEATSGSMVLRLDTTDRELQVLTESEFQEECFELGQADSSPEVQVLQKRGYKRYRQKGTALLYQARHPSPRWVRMNRNAGQVYRTDLRRASVAAEDTVPPREPQSLLASSMLPSRLMQFRSQSSQLGSQSTQFMEPEGHPRLEVRSPVTIDRAYSAPNSSRPEGLVEEQGLGSSSERTSFVKRLRSEISGLQETRVLGALEEGLRAAAKQQDGRVGLGFQASEAELAVASWLNCLPPGVRGLLVLTDAAEALTHEAPRRLLERLLNRHRGLHLLVTLTKKPGEELCPSRHLLGSNQGLPEMDSLIHQVRSSLISEELGMRIAAYSHAAEKASRRGLDRERAAAGQSPHESGSTMSPHLGAKAPLPESPSGARPKPAASDISPLLLDDVGDDPVDDNKRVLEEVASTSRRLFDSPECERGACAENAKHQIQKAAGIHHGSAERLWRSSSDHPPSPSETVASSAWSLRSRRYRSGNPLSSQHLETLQSFAEQQQLQERRDYNARNFRKALAGVGIVVPVASTKALTEASGPTLVTPQRRRPRVTTTPEKDRWDDRTCCARTFDGLPLRPVRQVSLPAIDEREAAEAFVSQLVRRGQDRLLGPLSQEEALKRLQGEKILRGCDQLTKVLQKVDEVTVADQPLFSQDFFFWYNAACIQVLS